MVARRNDMQLTSEMVQRAPISICTKVKPPLVKMRKKNLALFSLLVAMVMAMLVPIS